MPGGLAPCSHLPALRLDPTIGGELQKRRLGPAALVRQALRMQHHAPGATIFDAVPAGETITIEGIGSTSIRFRVPCSPLTVVARRGRSATPLAGVAKSLHVDVTQARAIVVFGHRTAYEPCRAPEWIEVKSP